MRISALALYRLGYRAETLVRRTLEGCADHRPCLDGTAQPLVRGWLQTWLVLMRAPRKLRRDMGSGAFCLFQLMIGGMLMSSLMHPLILAFVGIGAYAMMEAPVDEIPAGALSLFVIDITNILGSYAIFLALGMGSMTAYENDDRRPMGRPARSIG